MSFIEWICAYQWVPVSTFDSLCENEHRRRMGVRCLVGTQTRLLQEVLAVFRLIGHVSVRGKVWLIGWDDYYAIRDFLNHLGSGKEVFKDVLSEARAQARSFLVKREQAEGKLSSGRPDTVSD